MSKVLRGVALTALPYAAGALLGSWWAFERRVRRETACLTDARLAGALEEWAESA